MYESSCSYQGALELKRTSTSACPLGIKSEEFASASDWPAYRFCNPSTFEQLKQSVEKAKAALQVIWKRYVDVLSIIISLNSRIEVAF